MKKSFYRISLVILVLLFAHYITNIGGGLWVDNNASLTSLGSLDSSRTIQKDGEELKDKIKTDRECISKLSLTTPYYPNGLLSFSGQYCFFIISNSCARPSGIGLFAKLICTEKQGFDSISYFFYPLGIPLVRPFIK